MTEEQKESLVDAVRNVIENKIEDIIDEVVTEVEHLSIIDECYTADNKRVKKKERKTKDDNFPGFHEVVAHYNTIKTFEACGEQAMVEFYNAIKELTK